MVWRKHKVTDRITELTVSEQQWFGESSHWFTRGRSLLNFSPDKASSSLPTVLYFSSGSSYVLGQDDVLFIWQLGTCSMRIKTQCCTDARNIYLYMQDYIHSLATLLGTPCLQNCLNSSWHRFNEVFETFLRDFGSYCHDSITQLLQICRLHIHDENLSFHHIPKVLYWIEIWWLWRSFEQSELIVMFKKPVWDDLSFVTRCIILLEVHQKMVHCSHKGMDMDNNTQVDCGV